MTSTVQVLPPAAHAVIIASRESALQLTATLHAALYAKRPFGTVDLLINGNSELAEAMRASWTTAHDAAAPGMRSRLWSIALGDKANALNHYLHDIWPGDADAVFLDGYVRTRPDTPALLSAALAASPTALAVTGVPSSGRTAKGLRAQMLAEGGLHGNCFLLSAAALTSLRAAGFRLPLGLYRTDATLGAALSFGLDPANQAWQPLRFIRVEAQASWDVDSKPWWRPAELRAQWRRRQRQAAGALENRAVRNIYAERRLPPASLPATVAELVLGWQAHDGAACAAVLSSSRSTRAAWQRLISARDWSASRQSPQLLAVSGG